MTFDDHIPGAFAVVFPMPTDGQFEPVRLRLVETWQPVKELGEVEAGSIERIPWRLDQPTDIDLSSDITVRVDRFDVAGVGGAGRWAVTGQDRQPAIATVSGVIIDSAGEAVGATTAWEAPARHFGLSNTQRFFWFWIGATDPDLDLIDDVLPEGEHRVVLRVEAEVAQASPVDVSVDLVGVAVE